MLIVHCAKLLILYNVHFLHRVVDIIVNYNVVVTRIGIFQRIFFIYFNDCREIVLIVLYDFV